MPESQIYKIISEEKRKRQKFLKAI